MFKKNRQLDRLKMKLNKNLTRVKKKENGI